jgi:archaellum component FlaD/FlaE
MTDTAAVVVAASGSGSAAAAAAAGAVKEEETQPQKADESAASISENAPVTEAPEGSSKPEDVKHEKTPSESGKADTDATSDDKATEETSDETEEEEKPEACPPSPVPVVSSSKRSRPPYKYDINKITLRFLFANRDGLTVTVECNPSDTVGEVKGALLSVWPEGMYPCSLL